MYRYSGHLAKLVAAKPIMPKKDGRRRSMTDRSAIQRSEAARSQALVVAG